MRIGGLLAALVVLAGGLYAQAPRAEATWTPRLLGSAIPSA